MEGESWIRARLDQFQHGITEAVRRACEDLATELTRDAEALRQESRAGIAAKSELERLNAEYARCSGEVCSLTVDLRKAVEANQKLKHQARRMKVWIDEHAKRRNQDMKAKSCERWISSSARDSERESAPLQVKLQLSPIDTPPPRPSRGADVVHSSTTRPSSSGVHGRVASLPSEHHDRPNDEQARIVSDPATDSTESAVADHSQQQAPCTKVDQVNAESDSDVPQVVSARSLKRKRSTRSATYIKREPLSPENSPPPPPSTLDLDDVSLPLGSCTPKEPQLDSKPIKRTDCDIFEESPSRTDTTSAPLEIKNHRVLQPISANSRIQARPNTSGAILKMEQQHGAALTGLYPNETRNGNENRSERFHPPKSEPIFGPTPGQSPERHPSRHSTSELPMEGAKRTCNSARSRQRPAMANLWERRDSRSFTYGALRDRSVEDLHLEDFKLNPARNPGADFAYGEVVRKKDERRCLPGCTKPECCGSKFRQLIQIGGSASISNPNLGEALRGEARSDEDDERLLRNYLGDAAGRLEYMSNVERFELLMQARVQAFGQQHGKHRHLHPRPPSPPGFWRTDMPSTQEAQHDRATALELERGKVRERWREAMRPNGLWVFRDEGPSSM